MRVPLSWLSDWIELPTEADELAEKLTMSGLEVDSIERTGPDLSAIRVGHVLARSPHPNADRLSVCRVELGEEELAQIVCGAPNVAAGQKVAVASPGTRLPDGTKLKKSKIRGELSLGMILSERELGLSEEHEGILVLDPEAPVGAPLDRVLRTGDAVLEVAVMANRGDCASILGIAREVRALFGGELRFPELVPRECERPASDAVRVEIQDGEGCRAYVARVVENVRVGPSPEWIAKRLEAAGLRPINNVVDVTNLVMLELGQPLHAFDLDTLRGGVVRARDANAGETIRTLDGEEQKLVAGDLVIADAESAIAIAGVMGGAESEVSPKTTRLLIESAWFSPVRVRRTARRLGLSSEASYRFERGIDRDGVRRAADRAALLIAEVAGGEVLAGAVTAAGSDPGRAPDIALEPARVDRVLGTNLSLESIREALARVEVDCEETGGGLRCRVPSHRNDLGLPEDLIEEVARIIGYDAIPATTLSGTLVDGSRPRLWGACDTVRDALRYEGLVEVMTLPFIAASDLDALGLDDEDPRRATPRVLNPLVEREACLRPTLVPTLLHKVRENRNRQVEQPGMFEVSRVFRKVEEGALPREDVYAALVLCARSEPALWDSREPVPLFYVARGIAERLLDALGYTPEFQRTSAQPYVHPGASADLVVGRYTVGTVGELHPAAAARFEIDVPTALVELDLSALADAPKREVRYSEVSRHPSARRDLAVLLDRDQQAGEVLEEIRKQAGSLLASAEVFDRYEGQGVPEGRVSVAFRLVFQRTDRTLTDAEVAKATDRVVQMLAHRFGGELR